MAGGLLLAPIGLGFLSLVGQGTRIMENPVELRVLNILLIEDNEADAILTREALVEAGYPHCLVRLKDGEEALDYLFQKGAFSDGTGPDLILLDLNLPKVDGRDLLTKIKADEKTAKIPIVILTTSKDNQDVSAFYSQHGSDYIVKLINFEEFLEAIRSLKRFWTANI